MDSISKTIGLLLIIGSLLLIGLIYGPVLKEEFRYQASIIGSQPQEEVIPESEEFGLVIPKIGVNAKVFSSVDANNPKEYLPLLTQGVAQAKGSSFPGGEGNVFIFAHSADTPLNITRYNAIFYLIGKLEPGDKIIVYFQQVEYIYEVFEKKVLPPEMMADYLYALKGRTLTLQTCSPPGTTINRMLVTAKEMD